MKHCKHGYRGNPEACVDCQAEERTRIGNTPDDGLPPDPEGMNDDRSEWARQAVETFATATGLSLDTDGIETALIDLLADLAHLCDREELNLASLWERAAAHYNEETDNQGEQMDTIPSSFGEPEPKPAEPKDPYNEPPTLEGWQAIARALRAYGFDACLQGGGAAATYIDVELPENYYGVMGWGCGHETWTLDVYGNRQQWEEGCEPTKTIVTDAPMYNTDGTGRNHDPETIADAL